jgi:ABC-type transport system involved in cytochrome bd biosynthesis fused ATPase/permease subunit
MNDWIEYQKRERRRRIRDAVLLWLMAGFAAIGIIAVVGFVIAVLG